MSEAVGLSDLLQQHKAHRRKQQDDLCQPMLNYIHRYTDKCVVMRKKEVRDRAEQLETVCQATVSLGLTRSSEIQDELDQAVRTFVRHAQHSTQQATAWTQSFQGFLDQAKVWSYEPQMVADSFCRVFILLVQEWLLWMKGFKTYKTHCLNANRTSSICWVKLKCSLHLDVLHRFWWMFKATVIGSA